MNDYEVLYEKINTFLPIDEKLIIKRDEFGANTDSSISLSDKQVEILIDTFAKSFSVRGKYKTYKRLIGIRSPSFIKKVYLNYFKNNKGN